MTEGLQSSPPGSVHFPLSISVQGEMELVRILEIVRVLDGPGS